MPTKYSVEEAPPQYSIESDTPTPTPTWAQSVQQSFDTNTKTNPNEPLLETGIKSVVGAIGSPFIHPLQTIQGIAHSGGPVFDPQNPLVERAAQVPEDYRAAGGGTKGAAYAGTKLAGEGFGSLALGEAVGAAPRAVTGAISKGADIMSGGTKAASELNAKATSANEKAIADTNAKNAVIQSKRTAELNDHFQALQKAKGEEPTTLEEGRPRNAKELQSHKEALQRGVEQLDPKFQEDLKNTAKDAKAQLDNKYATVRAPLEARLDPDTGDMIPAPTVPSAELAGAVRNAEANLMGSSENIKQFRDILSKHPESDPDFVTYQGTQIPKGHALYDVIREGEDIPKGAEFKDLQGYYTELGDKISSGTLLPDVYRALKSLHDSVGGMMHKMAQDAGVGDALTDAQNYARQYYADWRDSASPLYRAIKKSPERGDAIANFQGADQTGVATLAKYNPELAKRANTLRGYQQQAQSIPNRPFTEKPVSTLAPKPEPLKANLQTIGPEDIQAANAEELAKRTATMRHYVNKAAFYVTGYRSLVAIGRAMSGDTAALAGLPADITEGLALAAGGNGLASFLQSPKISKFLTSPTAAQVATINPEIARGLQPILEQARKQGVKISPAVSAAVSSHATKTNWWDQPNQ